MAVSLKTIADDLGVSKATVSWILSGKGEEKGFSANTIALVKKYAKKVGYRSNLIARSLSLGYTKIIALIIPSISDSFYSQLAQGVEMRATEMGYVMVLGTSEGDDVKERQLIQTLRSQQVDGLIIAPTNKTDYVVGDMLKDHFPFVLVDRYVPDFHSNYVICDNEDSSYDLVSHLCDQGCRKVVLVTTDTHLFNMEKRRSGFNKAMEDRGLKGKILEVKRSNYADDIIIKLDALLDGDKDVDGFYFTTHYLAEEAIRYFTLRNIDYNSRFKMASMHSTKTLEILAPKMSRAVIPVEKTGSLAVDILLRNISSPNDFVQEELILKNSRYLL